MYYVYFLQSEDQDAKIYIGYTDNIERRLKQHNHVDNQGFTKGRKWCLVYYEAFRSKSDALKRERRFKQHGLAKRHVLNRIDQSLSGD